MKKLGNIKSLLSREEMKQIQGGSGEGVCLNWQWFCIPDRDYKKCCSGLECRSNLCELID